MPAPSYATDSVSSPVRTLRHALTGNAALVTGLLLTVVSLYPFLWNDKMDPKDFFDLQVYYGGVAHWLATGDLYNWALPPEEIYGFTYPPFAALVFAPFVMLTSTATAGPVFLALSVAGLVAMVYLALRGTGVARRVSLATGLWLTPLLLLYFPISFNMELGQINVFLVLLIMADALCLRGTRYHGILMAIAASIKLTPAVFGLYFLATRDWKSLARFIGTGLATIALSFAVMPQVATEYFTEKIFESGRVGSITAALNYNLLGTWQMLFPAGVAGVLFAVTALLSIALAYLAARRFHAAGEHLGAVTAVATLGLLISPISWTHHWVWFVPMLVFATRYGARTGQSSYLYLAATGAVLFSLPFAVWFGGYSWETNQWPELLALIHALPVVWAVAYLLLPCRGSAQHSAPQLKA